jgi:hypothetical protein
LRGTELDPTTNRKKRERICERLEALVDSFAQSGSSTGSLDNLAERLKSALAARTIGGEASQNTETHWKEANEQVRRLKNNWERLGPVPGKEGAALLARFERAYTKFLELRPTPGEHSKETASAGMRER